MKQLTHAAMAIVVAIGMLLCAVPVFAEDIPPDPVEIITVPGPTDPVDVPPETEPSENNDAPAAGDSSGGAASGEEGANSGIMPLGIIDETPPVLNLVTLSRTQVPAGGKITVNAIATDDIAGVESAYISFVHDDGQTYIYDYIYSWNAMTKEITLNAHQKTGKYTLNDITVYDKAGNSQRYVRNPVQWDLDNGVLLLTMMVAFTVTSNIPDTTPPVLSNVTIDKTSVAASGEITFTVNAADDISGVQQVYLQFRCTANDRTVYMWIYPDENKALKCTYTMPEFQQPGLYELDYAYVQDYAGNIAHYNKHPRDLSSRFRLHDSLQSLMCTTM